MSFYRFWIKPVLLLAFCLGSAEAVQGGSYSIDPPSEWKKQESQGDIILIAISQDSVKARKMPGVFFFENLVMTRMEFDNAGVSEIRKGVAEFIQGAQQKQYKDGKPGMRETRSFNGVQGALTQLSFKNSRGTPLCNTQFSFLDGTALYTIAFTSLVSDSHESLKLAERVLSTLRKD
jgi:hypothetical protein